MGDIRPMRAQDMDFKRALAMAPCLDLDVFVFAKVLDGPEEMMESSNMASIPAFSRVFGACHMLLIKAMNELGAMTIEMGPQFFDEASFRGYMVRKTPCPVWKITAGKIIGFGRNFEEAVCKLLITAIHRPGDP